MIVSSVWSVQVYHNNTFPIASSETYGHFCIIFLYWDIFSLNEKLGTVLKSFDENTQMYKDAPRSTNTAGEISFAKMWRSKSDYCLNYSWEREKFSDLAHTGCRFLSECKTGHWSWRIFKESVTCLKYYYLSKLVTYEA